MQYHKDSLAVILGLREKMAAINMNHTQLANKLNLVSEHVRRVSAGNCGVSIQVLCRLEDIFGPMDFEFEGKRREIREPDTEAKALHDIILSLAEAGWVAKEEADEAEILIPRLIDSTKKMDFDSLVYLYEQIICDTRHSLDLLESALSRAVGELYYQIRNKAEEQHSQKIAAKAA